MSQSPIETLETPRQVEEQEQSPQETLEPPQPAAPPEDEEIKQAETLEEPQPEGEAETIAATEVNGTQEPGEYDEEERRESDEANEDKEEKPGPDVAVPETKSPAPPRRRKRRPFTALARQKLGFLRKNFNPVPFSPGKTLDFAAHEGLFRALGLWEFVGLDLSDDFRSDLLIHLIANYDLSKDRSFVGDVEILIGPLDLARALKLPSSERWEDKEEAQCDIISSDQSKEVIQEFLSNYILLEGEDEDEMFILPDEVVDASRLLKEGLADEIDWARLMCALVKKELVESPKTGRCHHASHLQYLMKFQQPELFEKEAVMDMAPDSELESESSMQVSYSTDEEEEDDEMTSLEEFQRGMSLYSGATVNGGLMDGVEDCQVNEDGDWVDDVKSEGFEHCLRRCNSNEVRGREFDNSSKEEEVEREAEFPNFERLTSTDLLHAVDAVHISYGPRMNLIDQNAGDFVPSGVVGNNSASVDPVHNGSFFFENNGKRNIENVDADDDDIGRFDQSNQHKRMRYGGLWEEQAHQSNQHKRMRYGGLWEEQAPSGFDSYMEHIHCAMGKAKMLYDEKEHACLNGHLQLQYMNEMLKQKDQTIQNLEKKQVEEHQQWEEAFRHYEHEINTLANLVVGHKKALKQVKCKFEEYRKKCPQGDEPFYGDVGEAGGLVLTFRELERLRLEKMEEMRQSAEDIIRAFEYNWLIRYEEFHEALIGLQSRMVDLVQHKELIKEKFAEKKKNCSADAVREHQAPLTLESSIPSPTETLPW